MIGFNNIVNYLKKDKILDWLNQFPDLHNYTKDKSLYYDYIKSCKEQFVESKISHFKKILSIDSSLPNKSRYLFNKHTYNPNLFIKNVHITNIKYKLHTRVDLLIGCNVVKNLFGINSNKNLYYIVKFVFLRPYFKKNGKLSNNKKLFILKNRLFFDHMLFTKNNIPVSKDILVIFKDNSFVKIKIKKNYSKYKKNIISAIRWNKILNKFGGSWNLQDDYVKYINPNMKNRDDYPWRSAKKQVANIKKEITDIWYLNYNDKKRINKKYGVNNWDKLNSKMIVKPLSKMKNIMGIINANKSRPKYSIDSKPKIENSDYEIYIDYETINSLFMENNCPRQFVFMIGALFVFKNGNNYKMKFKYYIVNSLNNHEEKRIFMDFLGDVRKFNFYNQKIVNLFHWGQIEKYLFDSLNKQYKFNDKSDICFVDINQIFKKHGIFIKGALNYGLKSIANAMYKNSLISNTWDNDMDNGLDAMLEYYNYLINDKKEDHIIRKIVKYNYLDVKITKDIFDWVRNL